MTTPTTTQTSTTIPYNPVTTQPSLTDALNLLKKEIFLSMFVHHIGTVQSFNDLNQTASVSINYPKTFFKLNALTGLYDTVLVPYAVLVECPVICLGGGNGALTFPIAKGDECLVLFNDRDMSNWFAGGTGSALASGRLHSFTDAIVLVGLRSTPNVLNAYDTLRAVLRNGTNGSTMVGVGPTLIQIANNSATLGSLIDQLITAIKAITTLNSDATTGVVDAASKTALSNIATSFEGLLE